MEEQHNDNEQLSKKERKELRRKEREERHAHEARNRKVRTWGAWVGGLLVLAGGVGLLVWAVANQEPAVGDVPLTDEVTAQDHIIGNPESDVVVLEYGDFECPACGSYHPVLKQLKAEYGDRVAFVYRHFPLVQIHAKADISARASEAAAMQGKFWEMHDRLFENQEEWTRGNTEETLVRYAQELGLDVERFRADLESQQVKEAVTSDRISALNASLPGTPTFFLNGVQIASPKSTDAFRSLLNEALGETE